MGNTLKFGDGKWGAKKDSILAYNDENANFKPLPFTTSRASTATRINKAGLIEKVENGIPRVDYLGNTKGAMLLEPQSTNLIKYSEAFGQSYWTKSGASIEGDASTAGSELVNNSNWVVSNVTESLGVITFTDDGADSYALLENTLTVGLMYKISYTIDSYSNGALSINEISNVPTDVGNHTIYSTATNQRVLLDDIGETSLVISNVSVKEVQGFASPSSETPLGAFKLVEGTNNGQHATWTTSAVTVTANTDVTFTAYVKKIDRRYIAVGVAHSSSRGAIAQFDLDTQSLVYSGGIGTIYTYVSSDIKSLGNDWYRLEFVCQTTGTSIQPSIALSDDIFTNPSILNSANFYTGDGTSGVYIFASQLEQNSSATSYIKTSGTTISRTADSASKSGISSLINSEEGVFYFEGSWIDKSGGGSNSRVGLSDGTTNNRVLIQNVSGTANRLQFYFINAGGTQVDGVFDAVDITDTMKIAFKFKVNDFAVWINGVEVITDSSGTTFSSGVLNRIGFDGGTGSRDFYGKCKDLRVYKTALSDAELTTLTTI